MLLRRCSLPRTGIQHCLSRPSRRAFNTSPRHLNQFPNHYETLGVPQHSSAKEIKGRFYELSKKHHPDHNPGDTEASNRFVKISNAYAVLGNPEKRELYDRDYVRLKAKHSDSPAFTYRGPAGGRPASGLSRRRTPFKGPPPSFHRNPTTNHGETGSNQSSPNEGYNTAPGTAFGGATGRNDDVKHFNFKRHENLHQTLDDRRRDRAHLGAIKRAQRARREMGMGNSGVASSGGGGFFSMMFAISGILAVSTFLTNFSLGSVAEKRAEEKKKNSSQ